MRPSRGISGFVATLILVAISLSLSYVVYEGVSRLAPPREVIYTNQELSLGGSPDMLEVQVNASSSSIPQALEVDDANSHAGVFYFDGGVYGTTPQLCLSNATTFFSVYAPTPGILTSLADGGVWIDGYSTDSLSVGPGWHEVVFSDASTCQVQDTDGSELSFPGNDISSVPLIGSIPSSTFTFLVPTDGLRHSLLLVFDGGVDTIA